MSTKSKIWWTKHREDIIALAAIISFIVVVAVIVNTK